MPEWESLWDVALGIDRPWEKAYDDQNFVLSVCICQILSDKRFNDLRNLLDPSHHETQLTGEPGWLLSRQLRKGELFEVEKYNIKRFHSKREPVWPADPDAGPDNSWPKWARFRANVIDPGEFSDPKYPDHFYDAATFQSLVDRVLVLYADRNPQYAECVAQCRELILYWVEADSQSAPGNG